jgi:hypothetical protein
MKLSLTALRTTAYWPCLLVFSPQSSGAPTPVRVRKVNQKISKGLSLHIRKNGVAEAPGGLEVRHPSQTYFLTRRDFPTGADVHRIRDRINYLRENTLLSSCLGWLRHPPASD